MYRPGLDHSHSHAASAASALIAIASPLVLLWARRVQLHGQETLCPENNSSHRNHHLRANSSVLGNEWHRILSRAYVSTSTTSLASPMHDHIQDSPTSICSIGYLNSSAVTSYNILSPISGRLYPKPEGYGGRQFICLPQRLSTRMPLEILPRAHWFSRVHSFLRLLVIVLSGAVVFVLMHTLGIYRGNRYLELRKGEIPMVWPAHTNLAPTIVLVAVAATNFLTSMAILSLSFKRSFRRPIRSRGLYRIVAGSFGVVIWAAALAIFHFLNKASKASLGRYSCTNQSLVTNGRYQYRAVCEEQSFAFHIAVGAASAELLALIMLGASAVRSIQEEPPLPIIQIHEKKNSTHLSAGWKPSRPKTWIQ